MKEVGLLISLLILSTSTLAQCDFKKAARNQMLEQKIGVSGNCNYQNAVKTQTTNKIDETLDVDTKKIKNNNVEKKENIEKKINTTKKVIEAAK